MKKVLCLIFCLLFLSGCGKDKITDVEKEPLIISGFSAVVYTTVNDVEISANVKYTAHDKLEVTVVAPKTLKGTVINCKDGEYEIAYGNLAFNLPGGKLPYNMICRALEECLNNVRGKTPAATDGEFLVYTYELEGHICQLYTDSQKNFIKLSADGKDVLTFSQFCYITD